MKKFEVRSLLALMLAAIMIFALAACGTQDDTLPPDTVETDPVETEPTEIDPVETDPAETEPVETDPVETDPPATEPAVTEPPATEPAVTEPKETEPKETEPEETECAHEYGRGNVVIPTCQADGYTEYTCLKCGETKKEGTTPRVGHLYVIAYSTPTSCEADGVQVSECTYCGEVNETTVIPATGHVPTIETVNSPSFTHCNAEVTYCVRCAKVLAAEGINEHNFGTAPVQIVPDEKSAAGLSVFGYELYECVDCHFQLKMMSNHEDGHFFEYYSTSAKYVCKCGEEVGDLYAVHNGNTNAGPAIFAEN